MSNALAIDWHDRSELVSYEGRTWTVRTLTGLARLPDGETHFRSYDVPLDATDQMLAIIRDWIVRDLTEQAEAVPA